MSNAVTALGASLGVGDAEGGPYTLASEVKNFACPTVSLDLIDVSTHNNTTGFIEYLASALKKMDALNVDINYLYNDGTHDELTGFIYLNRNALKKHWEITLPTGGGSKKFRFAAFVTKVDGPKLEVNGALVATITLQPTDYLSFA